MERQTCAFSVLICDILVYRWLVLFVLVVVVSVAVEHFRLVYQVINLMEWKMR